MTSGYHTIDSTSSAGRLGAKFNVERVAEEMRIFVAYGYNERDRWIPRLVFPIMESIKIRERWRVAVAARNKNRLGPQSRLVFGPN